MNEYADENDECNHNPIKDVEVFQAVVKHTYGDLQRKHRDVVDNLKLLEYEKFTTSKMVSSRMSSRGGEEQDPYRKIDEEVS